MKNFILLYIFLISCWGVCAQPNLDTSAFHRINPDSVRSLSFLDTKFDDKEIFLFGEVHDIYSNTKLQLLLLKYLHKTQNVRWYLIEASKAWAFFINKFLSTGNDKYLDYPFIISDANELSFFKKIYEFNQKLPEKDRIKVIGVDNIFAYGQHTLALLSLKVLLEESQNIFTSRNTLINMIVNHDDIKSMPHPIKNEFHSYLLWELRKDFLENPEEYQAIIDTNKFDIFKEILLSVEKKISKGKQQHKREKKMLDSILSTYQKYGNKGNFMGNFGVWHTLYVRGKKRLINLLKDKNTSPLANKIITFNTQYENCVAHTVFYINGKGQEALDVTNDGISIPDKFSKQLSEYSKTDFTLIDVSKLELKKNSIWAGSDFIFYVKNQK